MGRPFRTGAFAGGAWLPGAFGGPRVPPWPPDGAVLAGVNVVRLLTPGVVCVRTLSPGVVTVPTLAVGVTARGARKPEAVP